MLLNHIAGLPSGGLLSKKTWREEILSYDIKLSPTLYSDYSSLRCMLEIEKKSGKKLRELCSYYFDPELLHWKDLPANSFSPEYGVRNKKIVSGEVHDNNCYNIGEFISHAGLFATIDGLCRSLINLNKQTSMNEQLLNSFKSHKNEDRFIMGFDHVMDPNNSLAGLGSTIKTFGHLGTSMVNISLGIRPIMRHKLWPITFMEKERKNKQDIMLCLGRYLPIHRLPTLEQQKQSYKRKEPNISRQKLQIFLHVHFQYKARKVAFQRNSYIRKWSFLGIFIWNFKYNSF